MWGLHQPTYCAHSLKPPLALRKIPGGLKRVRFDRAYGLIVVLFFARLYGEQATHSDSVEFSLQTRTEHRLPKRRPLDYGCSTDDTDTTTTYDGPIYTTQTPLGKMGNTTTTSLVLLPSILTTPRWSTTWPTFPPLGRRPAPTGMMTIRFSMSLITLALLPLRPIRPITRSPHQRACVHLQSLLRVGPLPKAHSTL